MITEPVVIGIYRLKPMFPDQKSVTIYSNSSGARMGSAYINDADNSVQYDHEERLPDFVKTEVIRILRANQP